MESEIVLAAAVALGSMVGGWLLARPLKKKALVQPWSWSVRIAYALFALFGIFWGALNLYLGFRSGEMVWISRHGGRDGLIHYDQFKRGFVCLGFMAPIWVAFGLLLLRGILVEARGSKSDRASAASERFPVSGSAHPSLDSQVKRPIDG